MTAWILVIWIGFNPHSPSVVSGISSRVECERLAPLLDKSSYDSTKLAEQTEGRRGYRRYFCVAYEMVK